MKTLLNAAVAFQGLLVLASSHAIRDEPFPAISPKITIPLEIYTDRSPSTQNISLIEGSIQQVDLCDCGHSTASKILGGSLASQGEFPWRVQILAGRVVGNVISGSVCGATILNPRWLLTAAHCFDDAQLDDKVWVLGLGGFDGGYPEEAKRSFKHNEYTKDSANIYNDIALVELRQELDFSNPNIAPACLPYRLAGQTEREAKVVASGWGRIAWEDPSSQQLRKVNLDVISNKKCRQMHSRHTSEEIIDSQICAYTPNKNVCKGDSGGSIDEVIDGKSYAVGVVSYGHECKDGAVYTRVSEFTHWIETNTGIKDFCKA